LFVFLFCCSGLSFTSGLSLNPDDPQINSNLPRFTVHYITISATYLR
jgi:hypothetical protein